MTKLKERLSVLQASATNLVQVVEDFDIEDLDEDDQDLEAAEWEESRVTRDKSGKFSSGGGGGGAAVRKSKGSRLKDAAKPHPIKALTKAVKSIDTKVKDAANQFAKKIGDTSKSVTDSGSHLVDSVKAMEESAKKGTVEAIQLATARASVAVSAAMNPVMREEFVKRFKKAKNAGEMVEAVKDSAKAINILSKGVAMGRSFEKRMDEQGKFVEEHKKDLAAGGVAAAVAIGLGVMASKKFGKKTRTLSGPATSPGRSGQAALTGRSGQAALTGRSGQAALTGRSGQAALTGRSGQAALPGGGSRPALPGSGSRPALPASSRPPVL